MAGPEHDERNKLQSNVTYENIPAHGITPHPPCTSHSCSIDGKPEGNLASSASVRKRVGVRRCVTFSPSSTSGTAFGQASGQQIAEEDVADEEALTRMQQLHLSPTHRPVTPGLRFTSKKVAPADTVAADTQDCISLQQQQQQQQPCHTAETSTAGAHVQLPQQVAVLQATVASPEPSASCISSAADNKCISSALEPAMSVHKRNGVKRSVTFSYTPARISSGAQANSISAANVLGATNLCDNCSTRYDDQDCSIPASRARSMPCSPLGRLPPLQFTSPYFPNWSTHSQSTSPTAAAAPSGGAAAGVITDITQRVGLDQAMTTYSTARRRIKKSASFSAVGSSSNYSSESAAHWEDYAGHRSSLVYVLRQGSLQETSVDSLDNQLGLIESGSCLRSKTSCSSASYVHQSVNIQSFKPSLQQYSAATNSSSPLSAAAQQFAGQRSPTAAAGTAAATAAGTTIAQQLSFGQEYNAPETLQSGLPASSTSGLVGVELCSSMAASAEAALQRMQGSSAASAAVLQEGMQGMAAGSGALSTRPPTRRHGSKTSSVVSLPPIM